MILGSVGLKRFSAGLSSDGDPRLDSDVWEWLWDLSLLLAGVVLLDVSTEVDMAAGGDFCRREAVDMVDVGFLYTV